KTLIQKAYQDCSEFQLIAKYPQLHSSTTSPLWEIIYDKLGQEDTMSIYKIDPSGTRCLCIPSNCRQQNEDKTVQELRETLIQQAHTTLNHMSGDKTYNYLTNYYFWPTMRKDTIEYCQQCDTCQRAKFRTTAPQGLARPLPAPLKPFFYIAMD